MKATTIILIIDFANKWKKRPISSGIFKWEAMATIFSKNIVEL